MTTHKRIATPACFVMMLLTASTLGAQDGGLARFRVGDWTITRTFGPGKVTSSKQTLIAVDETTATVKFENLFDGLPQPPTERKIALSELSDPKNLVPRAGAEVKVETLNKGKEVLTIKGDKVSCEWIEVNRTGNAKGRTIVTSAKIWTSGDVPIFGFVKIESPVTGGKATTELVNYGRGK